MIGLKSYSLAILILGIVFSSGEEFEIDQALAENEALGLAVIEELEQELQIGTEDFDLSVVPERGGGGEEGSPGIRGPNFRSGSLSIVSVTILYIHSIIIAPNDAHCINTVRLSHVL